MAHEIETTAYFGKTPWHGLGTVLTEDDIYNWPSACKKAGLAWDVELTPLVAKDTTAEVAHKGVRRTSDGKMLGVVGPRYCPLQKRLLADAEPPSPVRSVQNMHDFLVVLRDRARRRRDADAFCAPRAGISLPFPFRQGRAVD